MHLNHVTVKVVWKEKNADDNAALTIRVPLNMSCGQIKTCLVEHFNVKPERMTLRDFKTRETVQDTSSPEDMGVCANGVLDLFLCSDDGALSLNRAFPLSRDSDILSVSMDDGKSLTVEKVKSSYKKPFLGGFIHSKSRIEFHHAEAQTQRKSNIRLDINHEDYVSRNVQTDPKIHKYQQAGSESATQTLRGHPMVNYPLNKIIVPSGNYVSAEEMAKIFLKNIIVIQRAVRKWIAQKQILKVQKYRKERSQIENESEVEQPKNREDFQRLYAELEQWRKGKDTELKEQHLNDPENLHHERSKLVLEEAKRLALIDETKRALQTESSQKIVASTVIKAGQPKTWINSKGQRFYVETQHTIRAKNLGQMYGALNETLLEDGKDRSDVLLSLADTLGQLEDCPLIKEITKLMEREVDLSNRGIRFRNLIGLRQRISGLFLRLIRSPIHNPAIQRFSKLRVQKSDSMNTPRELPIGFCKSCTKYLPKTCFGQASDKNISPGEQGKQKLESRCMSCQRLDNDARKRQDLSIYKDMLNFVKKDEESFNSFESPIFRLKDSDIRHIVINFWGGKSVLSGLDDPYDLCLVRWKKNEPWSPWNCILLSFEEAAVHSQLSDMFRVYKNFLVERVKYRQTLARIHFSKNPSMQSSIHDHQKTESPDKKFIVRGNSLCKSN